VADYSKREGRLLRKSLTAIGTAVFDNGHLDTGGECLHKNADLITDNFLIRVNQCYLWLGLGFCVKDLYAAWNNSCIAVITASGASRQLLWPAPGISTCREPRIPAIKLAELRGGWAVSSSPVIMSVGQ